jgi:hypothetical protein
MIKISISPKGVTTIDVDGVKGTGCKDLTRKLENALGSTTKEKLKGEYYEQQQAVENQQYLDQGGQS